MTKVDQPKSVPTKPPKPVSRLSELAATKVVSAGEAFERDLAGPKELTEQGIDMPARQLAGKLAEPPTAGTARKPEPKASFSSIKRTFRYPRDIDTALKKFMHKYNLEKREETPDLTMEEVGVIMAKHFLKADPKSVCDKARGLA